MSHAPKRFAKKRMAEINVVPYIDVMLVLLVIFMVTAPMLAEGYRVQLPEAVLDQPYHETLSVVGGTPPYTWQKIGGEWKVVNVHYSAIEPEPGEE